MKTQFRDRLVNPLHLLCAVLAITVLALFVAPSAFACHRNDKPHGKHTSCDGSEFPPGDFWTEAFLWDPEDHFESAPGLEFELSPIRDYDSGDYISNPADAGLVLLDTKSLNKRILKSKRHGDLCHAMDSGLDKSGPLELVPDEFSYGWTDDCRDGQCDVEISLRFSGPEIEESTGGRSNQLNILMYSMITDDTIDDDPFREPRNLYITLMEAEYYKLGTSRTLVKCQFTPGGHGSGIFHTMP